MFTKYKKIIFFILFVVLVAGIGLIGDVNVVAAQDSFDLDESVNSQLGGIKTIGLPGYDKDDDQITDVVFDVIQMVLGTLALIFLILILWAGFRWMTSGGNEEMITKAKAMIKSALIGIIIIFLAYAITSFVFMVLLTDRVV